MIRPSLPMNSMSSGIAYCASTWRRRVVHRNRTTCRGQAALTCGTSAPVPLGVVQCQFAVKSYVFPSAVSIANGSEVNGPRVPAPVRRWQCEKKKRRDGALQQLWQADISATSPSKPGCRGVISAAMRPLSPSPYRTSTTWPGRSSVRPKRRSVFHMHEVIFRAFAARQEAKPLVRLNHLTMARSSPLDGVTWTWVRTGGSCDG